MYAVRGKLLSVDLNTKSCVIEAVPEHFYRKYLGGYGLGAALLLERMDPACDPLGPENILGFAAGYLTGTGAYIASRFMVFGKSPSTAGWGDANWAHVLNSAGLCLLGYAILSYKTLPDFLKAADGTDWTLEELEEVGRRLTLVRQIFNAKAGWSVDRCDFPERVLGNPPLDSGETKGVTVDLQTMVKEYIKHEDLDPSTGLPSREVLEALDLAHFLV